MPQGGEFCRLGANYYKGPWDLCALYTSDSSLISFSYGNASIFGADRAVQETS